MDYSPQQSSLQGNILSDLNTAISGGPGGSGIQSEFAPIVASGTDHINQSYQGLIEQMNKQLASRGFTASGTTGMNLEKIGADRAGAVGQFQGNIASQEVGQYNSLLTDALKAAYTPAGNQTATQGKSGTSVGAGAVNGLLGGLAAGGGGGGTGGGSSPSSSGGGYSDPGAWQGGG